MKAVRVSVCLSVTFLVLFVVFKFTTVRETISLPRFLAERRNSTGYSAAITQTPACGKICSYDWDYKEQGTLWPLLYKTVNCMNTLYRMAHSPYPVVVPPPRTPPANLVNDFTMNGQCPLLYLYFDQSNSATKKKTVIFTVKAFSALLAQERVRNINSYRDKNVLKPILHTYVNVIKGKHVAVIGTQKPWAEAMLINLGARHVTTIEYTELVIDHDRVTNITPYELAKQFLSGQADPFDTVFTYSSLEHSGLGRYGDPLSPFGDLEATAQVWCMVKPGGHFILAVPQHENRTSCAVKWNAHRVYGIARLQHLTANWRVLNFYHAQDTGYHGIYIMQKVDFHSVGK